MITFSVTELDAEFFTSLSGLDERIRIAVEDKFRAQVKILKEKVEENLTGKVLNVKSGALLRDLHSGVDRQGNTLIGFVAIEPENETVKEYALAHEYGGKKWYPIEPINKTLLKFVGKSGEMVYTDFVWHPPAQERSYLRSALRSLETQITEEIQDAIDKAL